MAATSLSDVPASGSASQSAPQRAPVIAPVAVAALIACGLGWSKREEYYVVPSEGLGYALGVAGLGMMVLLLLYSLRKRWSALRSAGPVQRWFQIHMALGILGPTAILFHSNFHLGSLNANVSLACMIIVSTSGIVGRFLYTRVHAEYLGRAALVHGLQDTSRGAGKVVGLVLRAAPDVEQILSQFRVHALRERDGLFAKLAAFLALGHHARATRRKALRVVRRARKASDAELPSRRNVRRAIAHHISTVRAAAEFEIYERLFALWHALHLPFCIVLFLAAGVHVVAVHMY